jgi:hypothetical protein
MMNMYVMLMIMLWDVNACLTPRGVTGATTTRLEGDSVGRYMHGGPHPPKTV